MEESEYMAKMKVHELAKELEINSKDIIETLANTEYAVKAAQSNVEDAAQEIVRKKFQKAAPLKEEPVKETPKEEPVKAENPVEEAPKPKKKNITAVFNAQYSKQGGGMRNGNRRPGQGRPDRPQGERRPQGDRPQGERRPQNNETQAKTMSGNDMRRYFDSLINPNAKPVSNTSAASETMPTKEPVAEIPANATVDLLLTQPITTSTSSYSYEN